MTDYYTNEEIKTKQQEIINKILSEDFIKLFELSKGINIFEIRYLDYYEFTSSEYIHNDLILILQKYNIVGMNYGICGEIECNEYLSNVNRQIYSDYNSELLYIIFVNNRGECYGTIIPKLLPKIYDPGSEYYKELDMFVLDKYYLLFIKPFISEGRNGIRNGSYSKRYSSILSTPSKHEYNTNLNYEIKYKILNEDLIFISKKYLEYIIINYKLLNISTNNLLLHYSNEYISIPTRDYLNSTIIQINKIKIQSLVKLSNYENNKYPPGIMGSESDKFMDIFNYFINFQFTNVNTDNIYKLKEDKNNLIDELNKQKEEINELKSIIKKMKNINKITL